jgi:biotin carboxylase
MTNYILFLCGGKWQVPWFLYLKEKGWKIILVDPYINSPCVVHADVFFQCDVKNTDLIYKFIQDNEYSIEFVTSEQTDVSTLPIAILSKKLKTKSNSIESVEKFSNKFISRNFLKNNGFNHYPKYKKISNVQDLLDFQLETPSKTIVKPADSQSSRGIYIIDKGSSVESIEHTFKEVLKHTSKDYFLAEEFVEGNEITLEGLCFDKKHITLTGSDKTHFRTGIASNLNYPFLLSNKLKTELINFHNKLIESTGLNYGITHSEYIVNVEQNKFWLIEMACRGGGSLIPSKITPWVSNINVYDLYYEMIFNDSFVFSLNQEDIQNNKFGKLHFFEFNEGVVESIKGMEECKLLKNVFELTLLFKEGDDIKSASDDSTRQGYVIILDNNPDNISKTIKKLYNNIKIEYKTNF